MSSTFCSHNPTCPPQKPDTDAPKTWLHKLCDTNQINTSITGCTSHPSQGSHDDLGLSCPLQTRNDCRGSQAAEVQWGRCLLSLPPHPSPHPPPHPDRRRGQRPRVTFCLWQINMLQPLPPTSERHAKDHITRGSGPGDRTPQRFRPFVWLFCGLRLHSRPAKGPLVLAQWFSAYVSHRPSPRKRPCVHACSAAPSSLCSTLEFDTFLSKHTVRNIHIVATPKHTPHANNILSKIAYPSYKKYT